MDIILVPSNLGSTLRSEWADISAMTRARRIDHAIETIQHIEHMHHIELWPKGIVNMLFSLSDMCDKYLETRKLVMFFVGNIFPVICLGRLLLYRIALSETSFLLEETEREADQVIKDICKICNLISKQGDRFFYYDIATGRREHIIR